MKWTHKALAYRALKTLSVLPGERALFDLLQRRVTKSVPRPHSLFERYLANTQVHVDAFGDMSKGRYLEFGAGWDLFQPLALWRHGLNDQVVVDLEMLFRPDYFNHVVTGFSQIEADGLRVPDRMVSSVKELEYYGIDYQAPKRVQDVSGTFDMVATTSTLEHIPFEDLADIMTAIRKLCRPGARVSMLIDYEDHWSQSDGSITEYNFLRYPWDEYDRRFNFPRLYQNRRRHSEYGRLFQDSGFEIIAANAKRPKDWKERLASVPLDAEFAAMDPEDVAVVSGHYVLTV